MPFARLRLTLSEAQPVFQIVWGATEHRPGYLHTLLPFGGGFTVSPLNPQAVFLREIGGKVECAFGFFLRLIVVSDSAPGFGESGMSQSVIGVRKQRPFEAVPKL